jgi:hypothetical protein
MLALSLLRWVEGEGERSSPVFFFNEAAETGSPLYLGSTAEVPLAGRGGEVGFLRGAARYASSLLLAGLGGEEELKHGMPVLDRGTGRGHLCRCSWCLEVARLERLLPCHGGKKKGDGEPLPDRLHRLLPQRCYGVSVWEAIFLSRSKATPWPIQVSAMDSGDSTSVARFFMRFAVAYYGCVEASGSVPASSHDGGVADLWLDGGKRRI